MKLFAALVIAGLALAPFAVRAEEAAAPAAATNDAKTTAKTAKTGDIEVEKKQTITESKKIHTKKAAKKAKMTDDAAASSDAPAAAPAESAK